jgi:hypothetical protein
MITLNENTSKLIKDEMESIPEKYQKPFNSMHEGLGVLREEYIELENEIFFGEKKAKEDFMKPDYPIDRQIEHEKQFIANAGKDLWKQRVREEAIQVAAMACRIIQELT